MLAPPFLPATIISSHSFPTTSNQLQAQGFPSPSPSNGNPLQTPTASSSKTPAYHPLVPAKRKRSSNASPTPAIPISAVVDHAMPPVLGLHQSAWYPKQHPQQHQHQPISQSQSDDISCICGYTHDDGNTVQCDNCRQWSHMNCYELKSGSVSQTDDWFCIRCQPRQVNYTHAKSFQASYINAVVIAAEREKGKRRATAAAGAAGASEGPSAGARASGRDNDPAEKKKRGRRTTTKPTSQAPPQSAGSVAAVGSSAHPNGKHLQGDGVLVNGAGGERDGSAGAITIPPGAATQDNFVDVEDDWRGTYVPLDTDRVPDASTRAKLAYSSQNWRGLTALSLTPPGSPSVQTNHNTLAANGEGTRVVCLDGANGANAKEREAIAAKDVEAAVRPARYGLQTTKPVSEEGLITPFTSTIVPSASYLADPLNAYSYLGMPKPHVHLVPPPLSVALDARTAGNEARFIRSGCHPNAVLRPVLCSKASKSKAAKKPSKRADTEPDSASEGDICGGDGQLRFAVYALRDLKASEEVVLGWEWDDGAVVHHLPALVAEGVHEGPSKLTPVYLKRLRMQMRLILDGLRQSFVSCACGAKAKDCALRLMETFADGQPFPPDVLPASPAGADDEGFDMTTDPETNTEETERGSKHPASLQDIKEIAKRKHQRAKAARVAAAASNAQRNPGGPLVGTRRGLRTRPVGGPEAATLGGVRCESGDEWDRLGVFDVEEEGEGETSEGLRSGRAGRNARRREVPEVTLERASPSANGQGQDGRRMVGLGIGLAPPGASTPTRDRDFTPAVENEVLPDGREDRMPPKMRKRWIAETLAEKRREEAEAEARKEEGEGEKTPTQPSMPVSKASPTTALREDTPTSEPTLKDVEQQAPTAVEDSAMDVDVVETKSSSGSRSSRSASTAEPTPSPTVSAQDLDKRSIPPPSRIPTPTLTPTPTATAATSNSIATEPSSKPQLTPIATSSPSLTSPSLVPSGPSSSQPHQSPGIPALRPPVQPTRRATSLFNLLNENPVSPLHSARKELSPVSVPVSTPVSAPISTTTAVERSETDVPLPNSPKDVAMAAPVPSPPPAPVVNERDERTPTPSSARHSNKPSPVPSRLPSASPAPPMSDTAALTPRSESVTFESLAPGSAPLASRMRSPSVPPTASPTPSSTAAAPRPRSATPASALHNAQTPVWHPAEDEIEDKEPAISADLAPTRSVSPLAPAPKQKKKKSVAKKPSSNSETDQFFTHLSVTEHFKKSPINHVNGRLKESGNEDEEVEEVGMGKAPEGEESEREDQYDVVGESEEVREGRDSAQEPVDAVTMNGIDAVSRDEPSKEKEDESQAKAADPVPGEAKIVIEQQQESDDDDEGIIAPGSRAAARRKRRLRIDSNDVAVADDESRNVSEPPPSNEDEHENGVNGANTSTSSVLSSLDSNSNSRRGSPSPSPTPSRARSASAKSGRSRVSREPIHAEEEVEVEVESPLSSLDREESLRPPSRMAASRSRSHSHSRAVSEALTTSSGTAANQVPPVDSPLMLFKEELLADAAERALRSGNNALQLQNGVDDGMEDLVPESPVADVVRVSQTHEKDGDGDVEMREVEAAVQLPSPSPVPVSAAETGHETTSTFTKPKSPEPAADPKPIIVELEPEPEPEREASAPTPSASPRLKSKLRSPKGSKSPLLTIATEFPVSSEPKLNGVRKEAGQSPLLTNNKKIAGRGRSSTPGAPSPYSAKPKTPLPDTASRSPVSPAWTISSTVPPMSTSAVDHLPEPEFKVIEASDLFAHSEKHPSSPLSESISHLPEMTPAPDSQDAEMLSPMTATASLAPPEPTKVRRSMADYKRRKKEREEASKAAHPSPLTPSAPMPSALLDVSDTAEADHDASKSENGHAEETKDAEMKMDVDAAPSTPKMSAAQLVSANVHESPSMDSLNELISALIPSSHTHRKTPSMGSTMSPLVNGSLEIPGLRSTASPEILGRDLPPLTAPISSSKTNQRERAASSPRLLSASLSSHRTLTAPPRVATPDEEDGEIRSRPSSVHHSPALSHRSPSPAVSKAHRSSLSHTQNDYTPYQPNIRPPLDPLSRATEQNLPSASRGSQSPLLDNSVDWKGLSARSEDVLGVGRLPPKGPRGVGPAPRVASGAATPPTAPTRGTALPFTKTFPRNPPSQVQILSQTRNLTLADTSKSENVAPDRRTPNSPIVESPVPAQSPSLLSRVAASPTAARAHPPPSGPRALRAPLASGAPPSVSPSTSSNLRRGSVPEREDYDRERERVRARDRELDRKMGRDGEREREVRDARDVRDIREGREREVRGHSPPPSARGRMGMRRPWPRGGRR